MRADRNQPVRPADIWHATCVAIFGHGCLIVGASGSGKSSLALSLMAQGAMLVSDDRVVLRREQTVVVASAPSELSGLIEARGIGLLRCDPSGAVPVRVVVDMDTVETARYPDIRTIDLLGLQIPLLRRVDSFHFAPALLQYLKSGRHEE